MDNLVLYDLWNSYLCHKLCSHQNFPRAERSPSGDGSTRVWDLNCRSGEKHQEASSYLPPMDRSDNKLDHSVPGQASIPWPDIPAAHQEKWSESHRHQHSDWAPFPLRDHEAPNAISWQAWPQMSWCMVHQCGVQLNWKQSLQQCLAESMRLFNSGQWGHRQLMSGGKPYSLTCWPGKRLLLPRHCPTYPIPTRCTLFNWQSL